nr:ribonuclease H-like domain-containing protein [Tanacetum cinerariifolium]
MMLALEGKNKTGFIDGSCRRSNVNEVLGWILNSISEELFLGQIFSKEAKHVWDELKETYDKVDGSVTFNLHHKINSLCQNEDFKRHNQLMKLMQFLMGLDNFYMQIRSSIMSRDPLPDVRGAYAIISSEESHRFVSSSNSRTSQRSQSSVFNSAVDNFRDNSLNSNGKGVQANMAAGIILDSGANQHLTYTDKLLVNVIDISKLGIKVSHPNRTEAVITKDLKGMSVLGIGNQIDGLYYLNDPQGTGLGFEKPICNLSKYICHERLGHPSDHVLKVLENDLALDNSDLDHCEIYQRAKQTREPFPLSEHKSSVLAELVHLDLWGPYKVTSKEGSRLPSPVLNGKSPFLPCL